MLNTLRLLVDASGRELQAGLLGAAGWQGFERTDEEAVSALFSLTQRLLAGAGLALRDLAGFVYGAGPGALLGLRLAATAIETWRALPELHSPALLRYSSLEAAAAILQARGMVSPFQVLCPFRRGLYASIAVSPSDQMSPVSVIEVLDPAAGPAYQLESRRFGATLLAGAEPLAYDLEPLGEVLATAPWVRPADRAEASVPAPSSYVKWSGDRHRAPSP